jgi:hypothetical protein
MVGPSCVAASISPTVKRSPSIRRQAYSLFDLASALASNNLRERHLGAAGVHRTSASGCVPTGPTTHTLIAYCDMLILKAKNGRAVVEHTVS